MNDSSTAVVTSAYRCGAQDKTNDARIHNHLTNEMYLEFVACVEHKE